MAGCIPTEDLPREVYLRVCQILVDPMGVPGWQIKPEARLGADLHIADGDDEDLVRCVENHFQIQLPNSELAHVCTVQDLVNCVLRQLAQN